MSTFTFKVEMTCSGCETSIKKILQRNLDKGISDFKVDLENKLVTVTGSLSQEEAKTILEKSGKKVEIYN